MRMVEIFNERFMRVIEVRITKKYVTLFHVPGLKTIKIRPQYYKEMLVGPVEADWKYIKCELRAKTALYNSIGKKYPKSLVKKILISKSPK